MKHIWKRLTAMVMAFTMMAAVTPVASTVKAVNIDSPCSLTVNYPEEYADLSEADLLVDVYLIAYAEALEGADTYTFGEPESGFNGLDPNSGDFEALAQEAAKRALVENAVEPTENDVQLGNEISDLSSGLYLVIVRGNQENYISKVKDDQGREKIVTTALTAANVYSFSPVLVSLPTLESSDWVYDSQITLKFEQGYRFGSLEIIKNLTGYVEGRPATFVFQIEAVLDGQTVYSDVVSITFTGAGRESVVINKIPVGAEVTVTEVYSGVCYKVVGDAEGTPTIQSDVISSVEFTNDPNDSQKNGGSIVNNFKYTETGWEWNPEVSGELNEDLVIGRK